LKVDKDFEYYFIKVLFGTISWVWKNIVIKALRFRILEILVYIYFATGTLVIDYPPQILLVRIFFIGFFMVLFYMFYRLNHPENLKIFLYKDGQDLIGLVIGGLLMTPLILLGAIQVLIIGFAIYIFWILIKFVINILKK
tara:strand:- start:663 stop:1082 length:420 start_codon:yes stop_codon:yes gene_type:complete